MFNPIKKVDFNKVDFNIDVKPTGKTKDVSSAEETAQTQTPTKAPSHAGDEVHISEISRIELSAGGAMEMVTGEVGIPAYNTISHAASKVKYDGNVCINGTKKLAQNIYNEIKKQYA